jgi:hypothetical protein
MSQNCYARRTALWGVLNTNLQMVVNMFASCCVRMVSESGRSCRFERGNFSYVCGQRYSEGVHWHSQVL